MKVRCFVIGLAAACPAGVAGATVLEDPALIPSWTPPVRTARPEAAPVPDLLLWRKLGTAFDDADALQVPGPTRPKQSAQDDALDVDLFGTRPDWPALP